MPILSIEGGGRLELEQGADLYAALSAAGLTDGPCGGQGRCGKCRVRFLSPMPVAAGEESFFSQGELASGWRLACLHTLEEDACIALPAVSRAGEVLSAGLQKQIIPDGEPGYGLAIDVGTTTIALALLERSSGKVLANATGLNSQKQFGQDVITRIDNCAQRENGLALMRAAVWQDLQALCREACAAAGIQPGEIKAAALAGNTVMTHLFAGVDPAPLAAYPFTPAFTGPLSLDGAEMGLSCPVYCLPAISAYVGGDITAGLLTCDLAAERQTTLFLDIGTNGEMVLAHQGRMVSCACAAGPALEGMDISCGMRAAAGAIEDVRFTANSLEVQTIGGAAPLGLCGSGLLALIAEMVQAGIIGENGRLQEPSHGVSISNPMVETVDGKRRFWIDCSRGLYLSQRDIRQVQLAKGAILAGIHILLESCGLHPGEIQRVLVAGQFGAHLKAGSLLGAGLLPAETAGRIEYVGNTSLAGAGLCLLCAAERQQAEQLGAGVEYLELSALPEYEGQLMKAMRFSKR